MNPIGYAAAVIVPAALTYLAYSAGAMELTYLGVFATVLALWYAVEKNRPGYG